MTTEVMNVPLVMPEIDFGWELVEDMPARLVELEKQGHFVSRIRYKGGTAWLIVGYDNVSGLLRNEAEVPAAPFFKKTFQTLGTSLFFMEGDEHRRYKTAIGKRFSPMAVRQQIEKLLVPVADDIIDDFGSAREVDISTAYGRRYGFNVISHLLGIPVPRDQEEHLTELITHLNQLQMPNDAPEAAYNRAKAAVAESNEMIRPLVIARRAEPKDDLISYFVGLELDGHALTDDEILDIIRSIYLAGADSTGFMMGNILNYVLSRPELKQTLLDHPEKRMAAIDELLRVESIVGLVARVTSKDTVVAGTTIPADSLVLVGIPGANLSEKHFPDPSTFSLERPARSQQLSFGAGVHMCLGNHLAREEMRVSLDRLLDRLPGLRIAKDPGRPGGTLFRFLQNGLTVAFDDILPAKDVPPRG